MLKIARVETARCLGGEGPLWDVGEQALYFIDNTGRKAHRHDPAAGTTRTWDMPDVITALALREAGGAVVTLRSGIHLLDLASGDLQALTPLPEPPPFVFNDGKVDRRGRFVIGASTANFAAPTPDGGLYSLGADRSLTRLDAGVHFSNGPCWSPDDRTFYFADSWLNQIYAYDYDIETGAAAGKRPFVNTQDLGGLPDGATVDRDGLVWAAVYGGGKMAAFRPDGRLERVVEMPVRFVASVMFGGPDLDQLYVATIAHGAMGEPAEEGAGYVYRVDGLGARGVPEPRYAG
jgi:sugar lactone lactonase YvrE